MDTTSNQQLNMDKIGQEMTQKLKKVICEREFANMITQTNQQLMDYKEKDDKQELDASQNDVITQNWKMD